MSKVSAPYMEGNRKLSTYEKNWWVIVKGRDGSRIGLVNRKYNDETYTVQFGADSPFEKRNHSALQLALIEQVKSMEGIDPQIGLVL